ncbi:MAG: efflux RND transporter periplasmic adaptor subunit [Bacteroidota bacterium]
MAKKRKKRRTGLIWTIIIGVGLMAVFFVVMFGFGGNEAPEVMAESVTSRTIVASVSESGVIEPVTEVSIAADVSGEVIELNAREGDLVEQGAVLVSIRPDNYQSALEQARAALDQSIAQQLSSEAAREQAYSRYLNDSASFKRKDELLKKKVIPYTEWEAARFALDIARSDLRSSIANAKSMKYQVDSRRASLKNAQTELRKTTILASMDGTLTRQTVEKGERVVGTMQMEGTEMLRIADLSRMQVIVEINENDIVHLRIGDSAHIEVDAYEERMFRGQVTEIAYSASMQNHTSGDQITSFGVKIEIDSASYRNDPEMMRGLKSYQSPFRPGMSAQVEIYTERAENELAVPIQAVTVRKPEAEPGRAVDEDAEPEEVVFVLGEGNSVAMRPVRTGISDDKYIVIREGLKNGERIVTGPYKMLSKGLKSGDVVRVKGAKMPPKAPKTAELQ